MAYTETDLYTSEVDNDTDVVADVDVVSDLIENAGVRYTMVTLHIVAIILASVGNGFLIVFIARHWKQTHRNVTAILILNLAVCDFINAVCYQPMRLVDILVYNEDHLTFCQVTGFFSAFVAGVGFMLIVAIAQERFLLICHPFKAKRFLTLRNTVVVMVSIWIGVTLCAIPIPVGFVYVIEVRLESGVARFCLVNVSVKDDFRGDVYFACLFALFFVLPLMLITFSYVSIFRRLRHAFPGNDQSNRAALRVLRQRQSLAKVMLSTAIIFTVSQGPHWFTFLISACGYDIKNNPIFTLLFVDLLTMVSPSLNPIVYSIRHNTVKKGITRTSSSIYSAIRHVSLQWNSSQHSDAPLTSLPEEDDGSATERPAVIRRNGAAVRTDEDGRLMSRYLRTVSESDRYSARDSQADRPAFRQTIYTTNGKPLRYSVSSV